MRYIPHSERDVGEMLEEIGVSTVDELFDHIPAGLRFDRELDLPAALSEPEIGRAHV